MKLPVYELHEVDYYNVTCFYSRGHQPLWDFIKDLEDYGADDYFERHAPLMECIDWQWWRWVPDISGDLYMIQKFARFVPSQGAFPVTTFWVDPVDGGLSTRWKLQHSLNKMAEEGIIL